MKKIKRVSEDKEVLKVFSGSEVIMVLEKMDDSIKLVAEGQMGLQRQLDEFKGETRAEFKKVEANFGKVFGKLAEHDRKFEEIDSKFETVFNYLSRIDDEIVALKNETAKADWKKMNRSEFEGFNKRLEKLENDLKKHKAIISARLKTA